jgi:hypothetical protein
MSNINIFQNQAKSVPTSDSQIVRIDMDKMDIGGRKSHLPAAESSPDMTINHVPNAGSTIGK